MDRIGWIDLRKNISHIGSPNVGRQPSMNEFVKETTSVNFGGTSVMTEGKALIITMVIMVVGTFLLNAIVQGFIG